MGRATLQQHSLTVATSQQWDVSPPGTVSSLETLKLNGQGTCRVGSTLESSISSLWNPPRHSVQGGLLHFILWYMGKPRRRRMDPMEGSIAETGGEGSRSRVSLCLEGVKA